MNSKLDDALAEAMGWLKADAIYDSRNPIYWRKPDGKTVDCREWSPTLNDTDALTVIRWLNSQKYEVKVDFPSDFKVVRVFISPEKDPVCRIVGLGTTFPEAVSEAAARMLKIERNPS